MRIAIVAPIEEPVPPQKYGGTEWVVYFVALGLGKKGHHVDLFAAGNSIKKTYFNLTPIAEKSLLLEPKCTTDLKLRETKKLVSLEKAAELTNKGNYDLIHNNAGWRFILYSNILNTKIVTTHHMPLSLDYQKIVFTHFKKNTYHISVSENQKKDLPNLNYIATIKNGVDLSFFPSRQKAISNQEAKDLVFIGRINQDKGAIEAVKIAILLKIKIIIAGKVEKADEKYYREFKKQINDKYVEFLGEVTHEEAIKLLSYAKALIMPVNYEDPCPLVPLEAMACGTPVIAFARGALPEQVIDSQTGFLVNHSSLLARGNWMIKKTGIDGLGEAVDKIFDMSENDYKSLREKCRSHIEQNFTTERMVNDYENAFLNLIKK